MSRSRECSFCNEAAQLMGRYGRMSSYAGIVRAPLSSAQSGPFAHVRKSPSQWGTDGGTKLACRLVGAAANRAVGMLRVTSVSIGSVSAGPNDPSQLPGGEHEQGVVTQAAKPKLKRPPLYKVILLNDDFTPMEFVVRVLMEFFSMNEERATQVMLHVHTRGVGVCGVFSKDVAETKVRLVNDHARQHQHPLLCTLEEA